MQMVTNIILVTFEKMLHCNPFECSLCLWFNFCGWCVSRLDSESGHLNGITDSPCMSAAVDLATAR